MKRFSNLYLFVHPMPYTAPECDFWMKKWEKFMAEFGPDEENVISILPNEPKQINDLHELARKHFGSRCIFDPDDFGPNTKALIADDLERLFACRGRLNEWGPYEIWTSNNARRWTEGIKKTLIENGLTYDPEYLNFITCGCQWAGCLTKYSAFMAKYLGLNRIADIYMELVPGAGFPFDATFRERVILDRNVQLFLFEATDGRPMAQFHDGLRGVWEPPHTATVTIDPHKIELNTTPVAHPSAYVATRYLKDGFVANVIDGCFCGITTILGCYISYDEFKDALTQAVIAPYEKVRAASHIPNFLNNFTTSFPDQPIEIP